MRKLADDVLLGFAGRAEDNLLHEFILRHITTHVPKIAAGLIQRILPDGTPVSLISVEDWTSKTAESGGPIAFMLAKDIQVDGVIVALGRVPVMSPEPDASLVALDEALEAFSSVAPRQAKLVELRYFGGLSEEEIGEVLKISPRTVRRDWEFARSWLMRELSR